MSKETLEEAAERFYPVNSTGGSMEMLSRHQLNNCLKQEGFIEGAKWQQERSYREEEVLEIIRQYALEEHLITSSKPDIWFKQFKKK
jgi:hypothetical protein